MIHLSRKSTVGRFLLVLTITATFLQVPKSAQAWEGATTHAGLTEQAALRSGLHDKLRTDFGLGLGLFETLTLSPASATDLYALLSQLNPTLGYVPNSAGRLSALGWLALGSVLADSPASLASNHFFDPQVSSGLHSRTLGIWQRLSLSMRGIVQSDILSTSGMPATQWLFAKDNPASVQVLAEQLTLAYSGAEPSTRSQHIASALFVVGGILHVIEDMGSAPHARADAAAFLQKLDSSTGEQGSALERIASLAFGKLGTPYNGNTINNLDGSIVGLISNSQGSGLADRIGKGYFSEGTLPQPIEVTRAMSDVDLAKRLKRSLVRPRPEISQIDLFDALIDSPGTLRDERGVCLARFYVERNILKWVTDDECLLEQATAQLALTAQYTQASLERLMGGSLLLARNGQSIRITNGTQNLSAGSLYVFSQDEKGRRKTLQAVKLPAPRAEAAMLDVAIPEGAKQVIAFFRADNLRSTTLLFASGALEL